MKKYKEIFHKKTQQIEIRFFTLNDLNSEDSICEFLRIIDIFELKSVYFVGSCFVSQEKTLSDELSSIDRNIVIKSKEDKKKSVYEVSFKFEGSLFDKIIKLMSRRNIPLYVISADEKNEISKIEILANDREFSSITFRKDVYDYDSILLRITEILKWFWKDKTIKDTTIY